MDINQISQTIRQETVTVVFVNVPLQQIGLPAGCRAAGCFLLLQYVHQNLRD